MPFVDILQQLLRKYIFSTDHKVIGLHYAFTSMFFLLVGFSLVVLIRWQLAYPGDVAASAPPANSTKSW